MRTSGLSAHMQTQTVNFVLSQNRVDCEGGNLLVSGDPMLRIISAKVARSYGQGYLIKRHLH